MLEYNVVNLMHNSFSILPLFNYKKVNNLIRKSFSILPLFNCKDFRKKSILIDYERLSFIDFHNEIQKRYKK